MRVTEVKNLVGIPTKNSNTSTGHNEAIIKLLQKCGMEVSAVMIYYKTLTDLGWVNESMDEYDADVAETIARLKKYGFSEDEKDTATEPALIETESSDTFELLETVSEYCDTEDSDKKDPNELTEDESHGYQIKHAKEMREYDRNNKRNWVRQYDITRLATAIKNAPTTPITVVVPERTEPLTNNISILPITDIHYGENVDPEATYGNSYNCTIAEHRLTKLFEENYKHAIKFGCKSLYVLLGGDLISGAIHDDLQRTNAYPAMVCAGRISKILSDLIGFYAKKFESVHVYGAPGNHSRVFKKPSNKDIMSNNYEYGIFNTLAIKFENTNVTVSFPEKSPLCKFNIGNQKWLLEHGDRYRKPETISKYIVRDLNLYHADVVLMGHWHDSYEFAVQRGDGKDTKIFINPSMVGPNEFASNSLHQFAQAASYIFVSNGDELISVRNIYLQDVQE